jgi:Zn-dependent oligopeptidase
LEMIEKTRLELANIDFILDDITKIVNAYISFKTQESAPEADESNVSRELKRVENVISDGELFEKIEKIKQMQEQLVRPNDSSAQP